MRLVDLHTHSNFSDGTLSPAQVVHAAAAKKVELLALADHDTVDGCAKARETAAQLKLPFVEAAEISTAEDDHLHIIGYGRRLPGSGIADFLAQ
ncbi:MAG TPA: PHP domain-containing protein, partial [Elusimicrobiales bacterium]|nr:PHP domain-containing protein [Elusimicrobiales bacterium]